MAETLHQSMASAYHKNPRLDAERARLRATDEEVPRAKSGFRPQITGSADAGRQRVETDPKSTSTGETNPWGYSLNMSQSVFSGFRTVHAVGEAEAAVRAGREQLRTVEQQVLLDTVTAYSDVVRDSALVRLREGNVEVLSRELAGVQARRSVREVTRTDVAQTQARRARAVSALDAARANLKSSRAAFERVVGRPPSSLAPPAPPTRFLPRALEEALMIGERESPVIVSAMYREQGARHNVDRIRGELLPEVRLEARIDHRQEPSSSVAEQDVASITGRVNIPLYEGGETHARVRQSKHTHVSRLQEIEQARLEVQAGVTQAWSRYGASRAQLKSDQAQVEAARVALEGVREEEKAGQRTQLDVLNAEQEALDAEIQLVGTRRDLIVAAYALLVQMGRLTAESLGLAEQVYDPNLHYEEVRSKWFGLDITRTDGRTERVDVTIQSDPEWMIDE
ncbi:MAG: TolC family outer membrane protein [Hyphomicrobiaceae bacterium]